MEHVVKDCTAIPVQILQALAGSLYGSFLKWIIQALDRPAIEKGLSKYQSGEYSEWAMWQTDQVLLYKPQWTISWLTLNMYRQTTYIHGAGSIGHF